MAEQPLHVSRDDLVRACRRGSDAVPDWLALESAGDGQPASPFNTDGEGGASSTTFVSMKPNHLWQAIVMAFRSGP